jgi:hypothetical protein
MSMVKPSRVVSALAFVAVGFALGSWTSLSVASASSAADSAQSAANRVFELRTYTAPEGKLGDLNARFRNHTMRIFERHGMKNVGYWVPQDAPAKDNTLIYIISHASREAAKKSWADFQADPEWKKVSAESQVNGRIVSGLVSVFMEPTDYSPIK